MVPSVVFDFIVGDGCCQGCGVAPSMNGVTLSTSFTVESIWRWLHFLAKGGIGFIGILKRIHQHEYLYEMCRCKGNTNAASLEVGFDGNMNGFHDCCHCRKMSARREHKGKSDENAESITVPAVHGGPYMQLMQTCQSDGLSSPWVGSDAAGFSSWDQT